MSKKVGIIVTILVVIACVFFFLAGASFPSEVEQQTKVIIETKYIPKIEYVYVTTEEEVEVIREVPVELIRFKSENELRQWLEYQKQTTTWLDFGTLTCVDYAQAFVELARTSGYDVNFQVMSIHPKSGRVLRNHALCNTIIGDKVYFIEPKTYEHWSVANTGG